MPSKKNLHVKDKYERVHTIKAAYNPRKTKTLVQIPALWSSALTPKASKAVRMTKTVVHPWYKENGRWMKISSADDWGE